MRRELVLAEGAGKITARIFASFKVEDEGTFQFRFSKYHVISLLVDRMTASNRP